MRLAERVRAHPLVAALAALRGNSRACVYTEPLWGLPYQLFNPFASLYMYSIGLDDVEIGFILSVNLVVQIISAFLGGICADKFGRRNALFFSEFTAWTIPCLLWALSQNFWWFLAAALLNGTQLLPNVAWNCLIVEDTDKGSIISIFTWVHIMGLMAVFFAPFAGLLVSRYTLVPVMRGLYAFACVSMTAKFVLLYIFSTETARGKERMAETKNTPLIKMMAGLGGLFARSLRSPAIAMTLVIMVGLNIAIKVSEAFFSLLATGELGLPPQYLAVFPIIRSGIMLFLLFAAQRAFSRAGFKARMAAGLSLFLLAQVWLIIGAGVGRGALFFLLAYVVCEAAAYGTVMPQRDALVARCMPPDERARVLSIMNTAMLCGTMPFGYLAGLLSNMDRRLPFALNSAVFIGLAVMILKDRKGLAEA